MTPDRSVRVRVATSVVGALLLGGLTACSGDGQGAPAPSSARPSGARSSAPAPTSPVVVAAVAVGTRSRAQVVALHAMGTSTSTDAGVPHVQLPGQGTAIGTALRGQVRDATRLPPPAGSPAAGLVGALRTYADLADRLATWDPRGGALPGSWFARLKQTDTAWRTSMDALSTLAGRDLLAGLPTLVVPGA